MTSRSNNNIYTANPPKIADLLSRKKVFIGGAGGLGSNAAMMLLRAGVLNFKIIDFDTIVPSNLNRQFFFQNQISQSKVVALKENLLAINPSAKIEIENIELTEENSASVIPGDYDLFLECFDNSSVKAMFVRAVLKEIDSPLIVAVSGIGGVAPLASLTVEKGPAGIWIVGDGVSDVDEGLGVLSTRVIAASALQAHTAIELLTGIRK